jgi:hypothetical protein
MYPKGINYGGLGMKNAGGKLLGAAKGVAGLLDNPAVIGALAAVAPELAAGVGAAKKYGLLEKVKNM